MSQLIEKANILAETGVDKPLAWWLCYPRNKFCPWFFASIGIRWAKVLGYVASIPTVIPPRLRAWAGDTCTAMDEPTSLKFVNRRIGELTKEYAAAQTLMPAHRRLLKSFRS